MDDLIRNATGYKRLDVYILMNLIQLETLVFGRRFLTPVNDPCGRQFDQMVQAARSGVKNLTEGSERIATSMQTAIKLIDVAKASLCELRDDYLTWLLDKNLPPWRIDSDEARAVYEIRLDPATYGEDVNHDLAVHIIAQRRRFATWFSSNDDVIFANAMLILISRALLMLDRLLKQRGEAFVKDGGFSERMTAARVEHKRIQHQPDNSDAPKCPLCGGEMRIRHSAKGDFWGCANYPACRGTVNIR